MLEELFTNGDLVLESIDLNSIYFKVLETPKSEEIYAQRCKVMQVFLDFNGLQEAILVSGGISELVRQTMAEYGVSRTYVYRLWSVLCTDRKSVV